jgi:hypothetical protein
MNDTAEKAARIEREIEQDRRRIEAKIGAIQEKLSPGQLIDEALAYAKGHGGGEFVSNLKTSAVANPLPVALIGIGLAWLMAKPATAAPASVADVEYPLAPVSGDIRRSRSAVRDGNNFYSHFQDGAGKNFRALADETGRRAGNFMDDAGNTFRGFSDASGKQIDRVMDESGKALDAASGWAASTWSSITDAASSMTSSMTDGGGSLKRAATGSLGSIQDQSVRFNSMVQTAFRDQPLVGGALAFAFGAAIGAALPRTDQENALMGEAASDVRTTVTSEASKLMDKGSEIASQVAETAVGVASDVRDVAKDRITEEYAKMTSAQEQDQSTTAPH